MRGPKQFMVARNSAERIGHLVRDIEHLPSESDHRGLVRFENSLDWRYTSMIEKLKVMAMEAPHAPCCRVLYGYSGTEIEASKQSLSISQAYPVNSRCLRIALMRVNQLSEIRAL
jgi:hypothetical protein